MHHLISGVELELCAESWFAIVGFFRESVGNLLFVRFRVLKLLQSFSLHMLKRLNILVQFLKLYQLIQLFLLFADIRFLLLSGFFQSRNIIIIDDSVGEVVSCLVRSMVSCSVSGVGFESEVPLIVSSGSRSLFLLFQ